MFLWSEKISIVFNIYFQAKITAALLFRNTAVNFYLFSFQILRIFWNPYSLFSFACWLHYGFCSRGAVHFLSACSPVLPDNRFPDPYCSRFLQILHTKIYTAVPLQDCYQRNSLHPQCRLTHHPITRWKGAELQVLCLRESTCCKSWFYPDLFFL